MILQSGSFKFRIVAVVAAAQRLNPPVAEEAVVSDAVVEMTAEGNYRRVVDLSRRPDSKNRNQSKFVGKNSRKQAE